MSVIKIFCLVYNEKRLSDLLVSLFFVSVIILDTTSLAWKSAEEYYPNIIFNLNIFVYTDMHIVLKSIYKQHFGSTFAFEMARVEELLIGSITKSYKC